MAVLSSHSSHPFLTTITYSSSTQSLPQFHHYSSSPNAVSFPAAKPPPPPATAPQQSHKYTLSLTEKWRTNVSFLSNFFTKTRDEQAIKQELLDAIAPLDRGADASPEDQLNIDRIARELEGVNPTKQPLKSDLLNGKWELIYTTSTSILQTQRPKFLRSRTNYQAINADTLRAQNMESWPFFNQVTADLTPLNASKVAVKFDFFKIAGLIPVKAPGRARGELDITYLDEELRVSRGDKGNLFILKMIDPSYRVPV